MKCRSGCGACCIVVSISSPMPGMPDGKKAGVRCFNLTQDNTCSIYQASGYPRVCNSLKPSPEMCGASNEEAFAYLEKLEILTRPVRR